MTDGPFSTALDRLAALAVPGVQNFGVDAVPDSLTRDALPALLVLPHAQSQNRLFQDQGDGFSAIAFSGAARALNVTVTHLLLTAPVTSGTGARDHLPGLVAAIDTVVAALSADVTLGGALARPAQVTIEPGQFTHGGVTYHGCAFRHTWAIEVEATP